MYGSTAAAGSDSDSDDDEDLDLFGEMTEEEKEAKAKKDEVCACCMHCSIGQMFIWHAQHLHCQASHHWFVRHQQLMLLLYADHRCSQEAWSRKG